MADDINTPANIEDPYTDQTEQQEREAVEDLILQNETINALMKGLLDDLETFKKANEGKGSPPDTVRFTMQLNILKDKKARNLAAINEIIKRHKEGNL